MLANGIYQIRTPHMVTVQCVSAIVKHHHINLICPNDDECNDHRYFIEKGHKFRFAKQICVAALLYRQQREFPKRN